MDHAASALIGVKDTWAAASGICQKYSVTKIKYQKNKQTETLANCIGEQPAPSTDFGDAVDTINWQHPCMWLLVFFGSLPYQSLLLTEKSCKLSSFPT